MNYKRFLKLVARKIKPHELNEREISKLSLIGRKYPYDLLEECVDIAAEQYFIYDESNTLTRHSVDELIEKIGGVAYNRTKPKVDQKITRLMNWGRQKFAYDWDEERAISILRSIKTNLCDLGLSQEDITAPFEKDLSYRLHISSSFKEWYIEILAWCRDIMPKYGDACLAFEIDELPWLAS